MINTMSSPNKRTIHKCRFERPAKKVVLFGTFFLLDYE